MNRIEAGSQNRRRFTWIVLCFAWAIALTTAAYGLDLPEVGQADFPNDDAVVLRQVQRWTLESDGGVLYEEHRWVKLFSDRAWRRYSDPRVDFLEGSEEVELLTAVAHLPDGTVVDLPEYSTILVSPDGISKWPVLSDWRQMVYIFSGVQNEAILEFHYRRTSKPGVRRWLEADLRIGDIDPVVERVVEVNLPEGQELRFDLDRADRYTDLHAHIKFVWSAEEERLDPRATTYRWEIMNVPSDADEPNSPPWRQRCGRLRFTNCPSAREWVSDLTGLVESSAKQTERIRKFAEEAAKDEVDEADKVRAIAKKLGDSFNFVNDRRGWAGRRVRPAEEVFGTCYGSRLESAGLALAALRSIGIEARVRVAVDGNTFDEQVSTDADLAALIRAAVDGNTFDEQVSTDADLVALVIEPSVYGGPIWWEPSSGIVNPNGAWRDQVLLYIDSGKLQRLAAFASPRSQPDTARVRGQLVLDDKAERLTGSLNLELTGLFINPEELRTDEQKRSRITSIVGGVIPDLKVTDFSVSHLSRDRFVAQASVESKEPPAEVYARRLVALAADTPVLVQAHLPLGRSARRTPIRLPAPMSEDVRLRIKLPEGWNPVILPEALPPATGKWGRIAQQVEADDGAIRIVRQVSFESQTIEPEDFAAVREAARALRSDACRSLVIEQSGS